jgi:hypothetical protein
MLWSDSYQVHTRSGMPAHPLVRRIEPSCTLVNAVPHGLSSGRTFRIFSR